MWEFRFPQEFFFVVQKYSNQGVSCRNIQIRVFRAEILVRYRYALRVTQSCAADYLDRTKPNQTMMDAMFIAPQSFSGGGLVAPQSFSGGGLVFLGKLVTKERV